jgi:hypothetical protein
MKRSAAPGLLPGYPGYDSHLAPRRNFAHNLDFNSLESYNGATLEVEGGRRYTNLAVLGASNQEKVSCKHLL